MKYYLVKHNETNKRFECCSNCFDELKGKCREHFGDDDIMIIYSEILEEAIPEVDLQGIGSLHTEGM